MSEKEEAVEPLEPEDVSKVGKSSALLDHVEKTLADNYRKEIDQEENIWRTLPFFAAILALEVTALVQLRASIMGAEGWLSYAMAGLASAVAVGNVVAFVFIARSIAPASFKYIAAEPEILRYAELVEEAAKDGVLNDEESALTTVKRFLARQYAATTANNRAINQRRAGMRTIAGLTILATVAGTLVLGALTVLVPDRQIVDNAQAIPGGSNVERSSPDTHEPLLSPPSGSAGERGDAVAPANPGGDEGVVHPPGADGNGGTGGEGK